jgi:hypothetical protein
VRSASGLLALALLLGGCAGTAPATEDDGAATTTAESATTTAEGSAAEAQRQIEVEYAHGQVSGDTGRVAVPAGAAVTITITSDVADEAHLHGYDLETELTPGEPARLQFDATISGVFELELHDAGTQLLTLQVG